MSKRNINIIILIIVLLIGLSLTIETISKSTPTLVYKCEYNDKYYEIDEEISNNYFFTLKYSNFDSLDVLKLYYTDASTNQKYYLYCLEEIFVNLEAESISLQEALAAGKVTFSDITRRLTYGTSFFDGGTSHHTDKAIHSGFGLSLVKCNTIAGNQNIYLGPIYMDYEEGFCK